MATAAVQSSDQATESLKNLTLVPQEKSAEAPDTKNQPLSTQGGDVETSDQTPGAVGPVSSADVLSGLGAQDPVVEANIFYAQNSYPPQTYYYGGYDGHVPEWEEYPRYVNIDGMEIQSPGAYSENGSVLYHPGYAYAPQMPYGPYSPAGTPLPSMRAESQLYGTRQFQYTGPFYQQSVPPGVQYISSPTPMSQSELSTSVGADQSTFHGDGSSANFVGGNSISMPPRPAFPVAYGSFGRGILPVTITSPGYQDPRQGYDGTRPSGSWFDSTNVSEGQQRPTSTAVPSVISQQIPVLGPFGQNIHPAPHVMGVQQPRPPSGIATAQGNFNRVYSPNRMYSQGNNSGRLSPSYGANGRTWVAVDKSKPRGRGNDSLCDCNGTMDVFSEQNRGPRTRFRNQPTSLGDALQLKEQTNISIGNSEVYNVAVERGQYNSPEFVTKYKDAKFFIIKSYSEDNIHKSIKYGVWASTPNGNKKLDAAYREAQEKPGGCPVFLFFSVNASGQFCGVAEMTGPVDFQSSVDYWQQDKWNGQIPVKWHIIKDISNSQFRHITLENNDNKPMTNSRDTQEVKFEQGVEVLTIFKTHACKMSILDDFKFYEARQRAIQERKTRQQELYPSGGDLAQKLSSKSKEGNAGEDRDDTKSGQTSIDLTSTPPSLNGEGLLNNQSSEGREPSSSGDALKGAKPTTDKGSADQDGSGIE